MLPDSGFYCCALTAPWWVLIAGVLLNCNWCWLGSCPTQLWCMSAFITGA